jgi:hypothetical protein
VNKAGRFWEIKSNSDSGLFENYFTFARKKDLLDAGSGGFILLESAGIA